MRRFLLLTLCIALPGCADSPHPARAAAQPPAPGVREAAVPTDTPVRPKAAIQSTPSDTEIRYVMVRDPQTGAVLPRLADTAGAVARRVNRRLDEVSAELSCGGGPWPAGTHIWYESHAKVDYAADSVFSVDLYASYSCGGPSHTNRHNTPLTFDLRRGKEVEFRDLFADYERDARAIVRAMYPAATEKARRLAATGIEPASDRDICVSLYAEEELARNYFTYTFTDSGVAVDPNFAQVIGACTELATVPYERLRPFAAPGGILLRVADARAARARRGGR